MAIRDVLSVFHGPVTDEHARAGERGVVRRRFDRYALAGGLAVTVLLGTLASLPPAAWEVAVFEAINGAAHRFEGALWPLQQLGMAAAIPGGALVLWLLVRSRIQPVVLLTVSGALGWGAANVIRELVGRGRPASILDAVHLGPYVPASGAAFPSGHAIVVFTLAVVLAPYVSRRTQVAMVGLAVLVAVVRICVGAHMPLDLLGGAAFGVVVGSTVNLIGGVVDGRRHEMRPIERG